jgi:hypothetical protein
VNGIPSSVAQLLVQYYKAILLPFEEWSRKNVPQQRPMPGMQGQAGQPLAVGQHGIPSQMPGGDLAAQQGVIPPTIPTLDGSSALPPHHPFSSSSQTHRRQPSVGLSVHPSGSSLQSPDVLAGMGSNVSQPFLSQSSPPDSSQLSVHGHPQDGAALSFDAEAEGRKRKGTAEVDVKRVRQRTGMFTGYPIMASTKRGQFHQVDAPDTTVVSHFPRLTCDVLIS